MTETFSYLSCVSINVFVEFKYYCNAFTCLMYKSFNCLCLKGYTNKLIFQTMTAVSFEIFLVLYNTKLLLLIWELLTPTPPHGSRTNMGVTEPEDGEVNIRLRTVSNWRSGAE